MDIDQNTHLLTIDTQQPWTSTVVISVILVFLTPTVVSILLSRQLASCPRFSVNCHTHGCILFQRVTKSSNKQGLAQVLLALLPAAAEVILDFAALHVLSLATCVYHRLDEEQRTNCSNITALYTRDFRAGRTAVTVYVRV